MLLCQNTDRAFPTSSCCCYLLTYRTTRAARKVMDTKVGTNVLGLVEPPHYAWHVEALGH